MNENLELSTTTTTPFLLLGFDVSKWIPNDNEWNKSIEILNDPIESKRIMNFKRPKPNTSGCEWLIGKDNINAKSSMAGRRLMIELVNKMLSIDYNLIKFKRTESNKPYLCNTTTNNSTINNNNNNNSFSFNLSHDSNLVIIIGSTFKELKSIGIDIMETVIPRNQNINEFFDNMKSCFTLNEWNIINSNSNDNKKKTELFYIHWCLKESYIKANGKGLEINLQSFEFKLDQLNQTATIKFIDNNQNNNQNNNNNNNNLQFTYFRPFESTHEYSSYIVAICLDLTNNNNNNNNIIKKDNLKIQILDNDFKLK